MAAPSIRRLPEEVVAKLRAGVVTPCLARCAEELVLKSLRSAKRIEVQLLCSPGSSLEVRDDGRGIPPEAFADLGAARGARGARGSSLGAMAARYEQLNVISKVEGQLTWCKRWKHGEVQFCGPAESPRGGVGTTVRVEDPKAVTQVEELRRRMRRLALLAPHTAWQLRGEVSLTLPREDAAARVRRLLGCFTSLCRVKSRLEGLALEGVISPLGAGHHCDDFMFLYVNGRYVHRTPMHKRIARVYAAASGQGQGRGGAVDERGYPVALWPLCVLNLSCPRECYDLDFLPDRSMVQFRDWNYVIDFIQQCLHELWFDRAMKRRKLDT